MSMTGTGEGQTGKGRTGAGETGAGRPAAGPVQAGRGAGRRILTVSYGTFSCTLEGFDEPFEALRAIADHFRDLVAGDRYFGAEPPVPDPERLALTGGQGPATEPQARGATAAWPHGPSGAAAAATAVGPRWADPGAAPAQSAAPSRPEPGAPARPAPAPEAPSAPVPSPVADAAGGEDGEPLSAEVLGSVAEKLRRIRAAAAAAAATGSAPDATGPVEEPVDRAAPAAPGAGPGPLPDAGLPDADAAATERPAANATGEAAGDDAVAALHRYLSRGPVAGTAEVARPDLPAPRPCDAKGSATDRATAVPPDAPPGGPGPAQSDRSGTEALPADDPGMVRAEPAAGPVPPDDDVGPDRAWPVATGDSDEAEAVLARIAALKAEVLATLPGPAGLPAMPAEAAVQVRDEAAFVPDPAGGGTGSGPGDWGRDWNDAWDNGAANDRAADWPDDRHDDRAGDGTDVIADSEFDEEDDVAEKDTAQTGPGGSDPEPAAFGPRPVRAPSLLQRARARFFGTADAPEAAAVPRPATGPAEPAATADTDAARQRVAAEAAAAAAAAEERAARAADPAVVVPVFGRRAEEADVARIVDKTRTEMDGAEIRRRQSAISHLKAAVAATEADRDRATALPPGAPPATDAQFRDDLSQAIRPRRPMLTDDSATAPETAGAAAPLRRPDPLVLVQAQRVDRLRPFDAAQPRRLSTRHLLRDDHDPEEEDFDDTTPATVEALEASRAFADFAERMGANTLPELLEAAAAFTATVEGHNWFSRPQILQKVAHIADEGDFSREESLRSFGMLLRQGKFQKIRRGQFVIAATSKFMTGARRAQG